ncbi:unnamed protein product [Linum trigynum]|uniref:Uncharacterized protein n=1 Tax=Linum trigynum TaxID=586398 RepID=A0AAV2FIT9_9ROSI
MQCKPNPIIYIQEKLPHFPAKTPLTGLVPPETTSPVSPPRLHGGAAEEEEEVVVVAAAAAGDVGQQRWEPALDVL